MCPPDRKEKKIMQVIHNTWNHMRRNPYQSMAAVLTMFLTMLLTGLFFLATAGSSLVLQYFESKPQITVFFTNKAAAGDADALKKTLEATGKVASVKFVSKDDALAIYREQNKSDPLLLEMVTADILPASLEVSAMDPNFLHELEPQPSGRHAARSRVRPPRHPLAPTSSIHRPASDAVSGRRPRRTSPPLHVPGPVAGSRLRGLRRSDVADRETGRSCGLPGLHGDTATNPLSCASASRICSPSCRYPSALGW